MYISGPNGGEIDKRRIAMTNNLAGKIQVVEFSSDVSGLIPSVGIGAYTTWPIAVYEHPTATPYRLKTSETNPGLLLVYGNFNGILGFNLLALENGALVGKQRIFHTDFTKYGEIIGKTSTDLMTNLQFFDL
jgi:hypothetical protein